MEHLKLRETYHNLENWKILENHNTEQRFVRAIKCIGDILHRCVFTIKSNDFKG